jgi:hypothetical protein
MRYGKSKLTMLYPISMSGSVLYRRYLKFKANVESSVSCSSFKRLVTGAFNMGFMGSTCTAAVSSAQIQALSMSVS